MISKTLATTALIAGSLLLSARADILTGLVGYWPLDDGSHSATANDSSGFGNNGVLTNFSDATYTSMWTTNAWIGKALLVNTNGETSNYVSVANSTSVNFDVSRAFTLAAWLYLSVDGNSQSNGAAILCKGVAGTESYSLDISGGKFRVLMRNTSGNSSDTASSTTIPAAGAWYHVVGVYNRSPHFLGMYVNGALEATSAGTLTTVFANTHPLTIGNKESSISSGYNRPFQGIMDEVHLYNRALSAGDVSELYATTNLTVYGTNYAPSILTQPRNVACYLGDTPAFAVAVDTSTTLLPVHYQWQFNGTNIAGATASVLLVTNAQAANAGAYAVTITNLVGTNLSSSAALMLQSLPAANTNNGLVGYWKLDDLSGSSTAADSSANTNTGTLAGFADNTWTNGLIDGALAFNGDGSGQEVVAVPDVGTPAPAALDFSTSPVFTFAAWVEAAAAQTNGAGIIANGTGGGGEQYVVDIFGGRYRFYVRDSAGTVFTAQTAIAPNGNWQHLAAVLNATNGIMTCYVNGVWAASAAAPFSLQATGREMSIGNRLTSGGFYFEPFSGLVDDVRVYSRDLTSADISALFMAARVPLAIAGLPNQMDVVAGASVQWAATVTGGLPPFAYQWRHNGANIVGATTNRLTLANAQPDAAGSYDLIVSDFNYVPAVTSSVVSVTITSDLTLNDTGVNWSSQGTTFASSWPGNNVLQLTGTSAGNEVNSAFYTAPLYIGAFRASFNYQASGLANGTAFCVQNDPRGAAALGGPGGQLGLGIPSTITPSFAFEFNFFTGNGVGGVGVAFAANGAIAQVQSTSPLVINSGDYINTVITYQNGVVTATLTDTNASTQFTISTNVNLPSVLGTNAAYIGFTGSEGTGTSVSVQQISDFTFVSLVPLTIQASGNTAAISWPTAVGGYVLQQNSSFATTNWVNVTNAVNLVSGQNQVVVPITASARYFHLSLE